MPNIHPLNQKVPAPIFERLPAARSFVRSVDPVVTEPVILSRQMRKLRLTGPSAVRAGLRRAGMCPHTEPAISDTWATRAGQVEVTLLKGSIVFSFRTYHGHRVNHGRIRWPWSFVRMEPTFPCERQTVHRKLARDTGADPGGRRLGGDVLWGPKAESKCVPDGGV